MSTLQTLAVEDPEIPEVLDLDTGATITAADAIGDDYKRAVELRLALRRSIARDAHLYACPLCLVPVYLVSRADTRRFFFRHLMEDGRCTARTRGELSEKEIDARRYNGAKESRDHIQMKALLAQSIECDPRFSTPEPEKIWKGQSGALGEWRRPDVQAFFGTLRMAFEIQLSTTFIRVIAERTEFYLKDGGLLIWVFKQFDESGNRLTQDDVFYNNNCNVFLINEETLAASRAAGTLCLECRWSEPHADNGAVVLQWRRQIVTIDELTLDTERQRIYFYDFDGAMARLSANSKVAREETLRRRFEAFWLHRAAHAQPTQAEDPRPWNALRTAFDEVGLTLPEYAGGGGSEILLNALYSAKHGKVIGWRFKKFIEVAHRIADGRKQYLWVFRQALAVFNRRAQIEAEDQSGLWRRKVAHYRPLMERGAVEYLPDRRFDALIAFLFPELAGRLGAYPPPAA